MSAPRDIHAAAEAVRHGAGYCDGCGGFWLRGPYCPSCGVFALDSHLGRCPECGQDSEYVNGVWRHVGPGECFLMDGAPLEGEPVVDEADVAPPAVPAVRCDACGDPESVCECAGGPVLRVALEPTVETSLGERPRFVAQPQPAAVLFKSEDTIEARYGPVAVGRVSMRLEGRIFNVTATWITITAARKIADALALPFEEV